MLSNVHLRSTFLKFSPVITSVKMIVWCVVIFLITCLSNKPMFSHYYTLLEGSSPPHSPILQKQMLKACVKAWKITAIQHQQLFFLFQWLSSKNCNSQASSNILQSGWVVRREWKNCSALAFCECVKTHLFPTWSFSLSRRLAEEWLLQQVIWTIFLEVFPEHLPKT